MHKKNHFVKEHNFVSINNTPYVYTGEILDDKPNGFGRAKFENGDEYIGHWKDGMLDGKGYYIWNNKDTYSGNWKNHKRNGFGIQSSFSKEEFIYGIFEDDILIEDFLFDIEKKCSFCNAEESDRVFFVTGYSNALICDECIEKVNEIAKDEFSK